MHAVPAARRALPCARGVSKTSFVSSHAPPHLTITRIKGCEEAWEQLQSLRVNERERISMKTVRPTGWRCPSVESVYRMKMSLTKDGL